MRLSSKTTAGDTLDTAISERDFQATVLELATLLGWRYYCVPDSRMCPAGWPDLALWRPPRFLLVELKTERGRVREAQQRTMDELRACGLEVRLWRPSDWPEIEEMLKGEK